MFTPSGKVEHSVLDLQGSFRIRKKKKRIMHCYEVRPHKRLDKLTTLHQRPSENQAKIFRNILSSSSEEIDEKHSLITEWRM